MSTTIVLDSTTVRAQQSVEVEISPREQKMIATSLLCKVFGLSIRRDYFHYVDDKTGNLMLCVEHSAGSHGYEEREVVRVATEQDKAALLVLDTLEKL